MLNYQYLHKVGINVAKGLQGLKVEISRKAKYKEVWAFVEKMTKVLGRP
jgi:hypothetical protein